AAFGVLGALEAPKLSRSHGSADTAATGGGSGASGVTVPSLAGQPPDVAERRLDDLGLNSSEEGSGIFGVLIPSDWDVCESTPSAGTVVSPGSTVRLLYARPGAC